MRILISESLMRLCQDRMCKKKWRLQLPQASPLHGQPLRADRFWLQSRRIATTTCYDCVMHIVIILFIGKNFLLEGDVVHKNSHKLVEIDETVVVAVHF